MLRRVVVNGLAIMRRTKMRRTDPGGITSNQILGIFGTGYAGLVTSVCFAELGHTVTAIDKDHDVVARLSDGAPTIHEPGLGALLTGNLESGRLRFTTKAEDAVVGSDIVFLCVGTPPRADGRADLCQVEEVARTIAPLLDGYKLIVEKSTVPARTAYWVDWTIRRLAGPNREFDVASNPEFLRGHGGTGLPEAGPDRHRRRHRASPIAVARPLPEGLPLPDRRDERDDRRIDQADGERVSRDQDLVHQYGVRPVRGAWRRRGDRRPGRRPRPADRRALPQRGPRLRWLLPAQRPERAHHGGRGQRG